MGIYVVILLRILIPLTIFRWRLIGAILSILVDIFDYVILALYSRPNLPDYQQIDKIFDYYYLSIEACVVLFWQSKLSRNAGLALFIYRLIGIILFEITKIRALLFFFPNAFELFYLYYTIYKRFLHKEPFKTLSYLVIFISLILIIKLIQEYIIHLAQLEYWRWFHFPII